MSLPLGTEGPLRLDAVAAVVYGVLGLFTLGIAWVIYTLFFIPLEKKQRSEMGESTPHVVNGVGEEKKKVDKDKGTKGSKAKARSRTLSEVKEEVHTWTASVFKGHAEYIQDMQWSSNSKFIASCARDRIVLLWFAKDLLSKDRRNIRVNIPFDYATLISWSPDNTAFIITKKEERVLEVFKMGRKAEGAHVTVSPKMKFHGDEDEKVDIVGLGISPNGLFIMSCTVTGIVTLWGVKGGVIHKFQTNPEAPIIAAKLSPCGRFVAICGKDCDLHEIIFTPPMNQFNSIKSHGKLAHPKTVVQVEFNIDSSRIVTVMEDGGWRMYDTTGGHISIICSGKSTAAPTKAELLANTTDEYPAILPTIAVSPDNRLVAIGAFNVVNFFQIVLGNSDTTVEAEWTIPCDNVAKILFASDGQYILIASGKSILVLHNICGFLVLVRDVVALVGELSNLTPSQIMKSTTLKSRFLREASLALDKLRQIGESKEIYGVNAKEIKKMEKVIDAAQD